MSANYFDRINGVSYGNSGTGLDQLVDSIQTDYGLEGRISQQDINGGAAAANAMNGIIVEAVNATGVAPDGVFSADDVRVLNAYIRANHYDQWASLHGDDEAGEESGYHLVQNDGASERYRGDNLVNTVADGIYHLGFEIQGDTIVNEDGDANASVQQLAEWLTQIYTDHSTTATGLDKITDLIMADSRLDTKISDAQIAAGADAANAMNAIIVEAMQATGVSADGDISADDVRALNGYIRSNYQEQWAQLHGDDENGEESGYHLVQNDGASTRYFGENLVNTVADGIYHLGFEIQDDTLLNEDGNANAAVGDVADWLNYFFVDQSTTGTGLDQLVDAIKSDRGLARNTSAGDIKQGAAAANAMNAIIVEAIVNTGAADDANISVDDVRAINAYIRANYLDQWVALHGDDENAEETGYHLVQNDGGSIKYRGDKLIDTVADGIYHLGFEIQGDRILNEDGNANANLGDLATWLNHYYLNAAISYGSDGADTLRGLNDDELFMARGGNDKVIAGAGNDVVYGGAGNDVLYGQDGDDQLSGDAGNDKLVGGDGNDMLGGGDGNDTLVGQAGDDMMAGGSGKDKLYGGAGADLMFGNDGDDILSGQGGDDELWGDAGADKLYGGDGADRLFGGDGNDYLNGGDGTDTLSGGAGNDRISGGSGDDLLSGEAGDDIIYAGSGVDHVSGGDGNDVLSGQDGDDTLLGEGGNDKLHGGDGNDLLLGAEGDDYLSGGDGADRLVGDVGNDRLSGGSGDDTLSGDGGDDVLYGGSGIDQLTGGDGNDVLSGQDGDDQLDGGNGNDKLHGGDGSDRLDGGDGNDYLAGNDGADNLVGGAGDDRLSGGDGVDVLSGDEGDDILYGGAAADQLTGGDGNDVLSGQSGDDVLSGDGGNDKLHGGDGADLLSAGAGDDYLAGNDGADRLLAGEGNDRLSGGSGDDFLDGAQGDDTLYGGSGDDWLDGGLGNDYLVGNSGRDGMFGGEGNDTLRGGSGDDLLSGGIGDDRLYGDSGADLLDGGDGDDTLVGCAGDDRLLGGAGDDLLKGYNDDDLLVDGLGNDRLFGGNGNDALVAIADGVSDMLNGGGGADTYAFVTSPGQGIGADAVYGYSSAQGDRLLVVGEGLSCTVEHLDSNDNGRADYTLFNLFAADDSAMGSVAVYHNLLSADDLSFVPALEQLNGVAVPALVEIA